MKQVTFYTRVSYLLFCLLVTSCATYRQNIMFKVPQGYPLQHQIEIAEKNYIIQKNDHLNIEVYTNDGERIIDPNFESFKNSQSQGATGHPALSYLVDIKGVVKFPLIGELKVEGLTIRVAEELLEQEFDKFYKQAYVVLKFMNKRVVVLGAPGGQVIPLINENVRLVEVLALAKGLDNDSKAKNIRILRGEKVFVADLTTIDGYIKNNVIIEPGDVVYIEPIRKPFLEGLRDYAPVLSMFVSIATLVVVLFGVK